LHLKDAVSRNLGHNKSLIFIVISKQTARFCTKRTITPNNSGKTSITEFFAHVLGDEPKKLRLEDFSAARRDAFLVARQLRREGKDEKDVLAALPVITATMFVSYDPANELGALAPFVIDLDPECKTAKIRIEYKPAQTGLALLLDPPIPAGGADDAARFFKNLKEAVPKTYEYHVTAVDPPRFFQRAHH
jgi:putative ATP-dependent endonuclease of OLD family